MTIDDFQHAFDQGYLTSELLVKLYLERIKAYDQDFNAINQINEEAINQAIKLDKERSAGQIRGPLHGIPLLIKTNINYTQLATTAGAKALLDNYPISNATVVQSLIDSGAIILASTNMSEFAFSAYNSTSSFGTVKNAFNLAYSPYGSSGGSAVAVALSFGVAALGTDTNSSIRIPASAASLVGLRSTIGLVSRHGVIPYDIERDTVGPLTKTVTDNAIIMNIIAGVDANDQATSDKKKADYVMAAKKTSLKEKTIGVIDNYYLGKSGAALPVNATTNKEIITMMKQSIEDLSSTGAKIVYLDNLATSYYQDIANKTTAGITFCDNFNNYLITTKGPIRSFNQLASSMGRIYDLSGYAAGCNYYYAPAKTRDEQKAIYQNYVAKLMKDNNLDVIIYPTTKNKNLKINVTSGLLSPGSSLGSVINYPSITVPMGFDQDGLAYGLEFLAGYNNEKELFEIAGAFEKAHQQELASSPLTPCLYQIPAVVDELIDLAEAPSNSDYSKMTATLKKTMIDLKKDTRSYFINYNQNENNEKLAQELVNRYQDFAIKRKGIVNKISTSLYLNSLREWLGSNWLIIGIIIIGLWFLKKINHHKKHKKRFKKRK